LPLNQVNYAHKAAATIEKVNLRNLSSDRIKRRRNADSSERVWEKKAEAGQRTAKIEGL